MDSRVDSTPAPVRRYLRHALGDCRTPIAAVRLRQSGRLRLDGTSPRWMPFEASHVAVPEEAAFTWTARVKVLGPLGVRVVDRLAGGRGSSEVYVLSAIRISKSRSRPEMDAGALHRFLAEAVWYPTALVPGGHVAWTAIDDRRALATAVAGAAKASLEFRFDDADQVTGVYTPARWGRFGGRLEQRGWEGHFSDYVSVDELRVPKRGNVGWYAGAEWQMVWEGVVEEAAYRFR